MPHLIRHILYGLATLLLQILVLRYLGIDGARPDAVLLYVAWIGLSYGRRTGALTGCALGFIMDVIDDTWGIQMFAKTITGFVAGYFYADEQERLKIYPRQAFVGGFVFALFHHGLFVILKSIEIGQMTLFMVVSLWLGAALYTGFVAVIAAWFSTR